MIRKINNHCYEANNAFYFLHNNLLYKFCESGLFFDSEEKFKLLIYYNFEENKVHLHYCKSSFNPCFIFKFIGIKLDDLEPLFSNLILLNCLRE